VQEEI